MQQNFLAEIKKFSQFGLEKQDFVAVFFTDRKKCNLNLTIESLPEKSAVIFREYDLKITERRKLATEIVELCRQKNHKILIGKNLALARELKADGVHFSDLEKISLANFLFFLWINFCKNFIKKSARRKFMCSLACHSLKSVLLAQNSVANLLFISPAFKTKSHQSAKPLGLRNLKEIAKVSRKPIYALGGVNQKNIAIVRKLGFAGFGGIECFAKNI